MKPYRFLHRGGPTGSALSFSGEIWPMAKDGQGQGFDPWGPFLLSPEKWWPCRKARATGGFNSWSARLQAIGLPCRHFKGGLVEPNWASLCLLGLLQSKTRDLPKAESLFCFGKQPTHKWLVDMNPFALPGPRFSALSETYLVPPPQLGAERYLLTFGWKPAVAKA